MVLMVLALQGSDLKDSWTKSGRRGFEGSMFWVLGQAGYGFELGRVKNQVLVWYHYPSPCSLWL